MYAIIATGGKQYKVSEGDVIDVEKIVAEVGAEVTFDNVLAVGGEALKVAGDVAGRDCNGNCHGAGGKAKKVIVYRYKEEDRLSQKERPSPALHPRKDRQDQRLMFRAGFLLRMVRGVNNARPVTQQRVLYGNGHDSSRYFLRSRGTVRLFRVLGSCR